jgi:hypothetical protein
VKNIVAVGCLLSILGLASAQSPGKLDLNFQQSPAKPTPDWVKLVDRRSHEFA